MYHLGIWNSDKDFEETRLYKWNSAYLDAELWQLDLEEEVPAFYIGLFSWITKSGFCVEDNKN